jgi:hypothetical protein
MSAARRAATDIQCPTPLSQLNEPEGGFMHRSLNYRGSLKHLISPQEHIAYVKWVRGVAALYGSVALLTVIGLAALQQWP